MTPLGWAILAGIVLWLLWLVVSLCCVAARGDDTEERELGERRS